MKDIFGGTGCEPIRSGGDELAPGQPATCTHDDVRHGITTLFAALNLLEGNMIGRRTQRHRHEELLRFLNTAKEAVPASKVVQVVLDNYRTRTYAKVRACLSRHAHWVFHFTPTGLPWLNAFEGFFWVLTCRRLQRGTFTEDVNISENLGEKLSCSMVRNHIQRSSDRVGDFDVRTCQFSMGNMLSEWRLVIGTRAIRKGAATRDAVPRSNA